VIIAPVDGFGGDFRPIVLSGDLYRFVGIFEAVCADGRRSLSILRICELFRGEGYVAWVVAEVGC